MYWWMLKLSAIQKTSNCWATLRSSHWRCSIEKAVLRNLTVFTSFQQHLFWRTSANGCFCTLNSWFQIFTSLLFRGDFLGLCQTFKSNPPEVFLRKSLLKICKKNYRRAPMPNLSQKVKSSVFSHKKREVGKIGWLFLFHRKELVLLNLISRYVTSTSE